VEKPDSLSKKYTIWGLKLIIVCITFRFLFFISFYFYFFVSAPKGAITTVF